MKRETEHVSGMTVDCCNLRETRHVPEFDDSIARRGQQFAAGAEGDVPYSMGMSSQVGKFPPSPIREEEPEDRRGGPRSPRCKKSRPPVGREDR